jgi:hypothetical protein
MFFLTISGGAGIGFARVSLATFHKGYQVLENFQVSLLRDPAPKPDEGLV